MPTTTLLWVIGIAEVRRLCAPAHGDAPALREVARRRLRFDEPALPGRLGELGPVFRRPARVADPDAPTPADVDALLAGAAIPPDRLVARWRILQAWLDERAVAHLAVRPPAAGPVAAALAELAGSEATLPLPPPPGCRVGYADAPRAAAAAAGLAAPRHRLARSDRRPAAALVELLAATGRRSPSDGVLVISA